MANKNNIQFEGNLAGELDTRYVPTIGKKVASGRLIHNHTRKTAEGKYERTGDTTTMPVVFWEEVLGDFGKGDLLGVEGYLKDRSWVGKDGETRYVTEIIVTKVVD